MLKKRTLLVAGFTCSLIFVTISIAVVSPSTHLGSLLSSLDQLLMSSFRVPSEADDPIGPSWFEEAARDITALGSVSILGLIVTIGVVMLLTLGRTRSAAVLVHGSLGCFLFNSLLKSFFDRPRPNLVPHEAVVFTPSFPSGHAMVSASTFATMAFLLIRSTLFINHKPRIFLIAATSIILIGTSRVYLGVHWPSDVFAGWSAGIAWSCLTVALFCVDRVRAPKDCTRLRKS